MKVHLFYTGWVAKDHKSFTTGGVQTYLINLSKIFAEEGFDEFHYYRGSSIENEVVIDGIHVHEIVCKAKKNRIRVKKVFEHFKHVIDKENDIVLFADDYQSTNALDYHSISIQHGIFWDIPEEQVGKFSFAVMFVRKCLDAWRRMKHIRNVKIMVCVDYNFPNWYRATFPAQVVKTRVIPNFTHIMPRVEKPKGRINIVFARRFEKFRGTRVFGEAVKKILGEYDNVFVTLAGWGADIKWLHQQFDGDERVTFTEYATGTSLEFHADKHIAVVPTVGSEGTSLSLLEAMSAQCAVVASDVGGITNVVIDGFNGFMVPSGSSTSLYEALKRLIDHPEEIKRLSDNAYNVVKESFSYEKWKSEWIRIIRMARQM